MSLSKEGSPCFHQTHKRGQEPLTHSTSRQWVKPWELGQVGREDPFCGIRWWLTISWWSSQQEAELVPACWASEAREGL